MKKYVIGIDFGTLSARALLIDAESGESIGVSVFEYPHGVMDEALPTGEKLDPTAAFQHPEDYLEALGFVIREVIEKGGISASDVSGVGIDFTACTMLPMDKDGTPLCLKPEFAREPHAYVKLWKHHASWQEGEDFNALGSSKGEKWIDRNGGKISCEGIFPKVLETLRKAPHVYNAAYRFIEAGDWLTLILTGNEVHSASFAGFKALWDSDDGYPSNEFLKELDPRLDGIVGTKISCNVGAMGSIAGYVNDRGAKLTGLSVGTPLAMPVIDAHAALPALNVTGDGELLMILGTSACQMMNSKEGRTIEGICGYSKGSVYPDIYTYETAQAAVGDLFHWFVNNCVPANYEDEAKERGISIHKLLREKAKELKVGDNRLVALDWWNGNRSVLSDPTLTGMLFGMTLTTRPEEIYRALIESTAFGVRVIIENFEERGVKIEKICAAGGIALKDEMMMQIYSDVLRRKIVVSGSDQAAALGSAIYASVAAGIYKSIEEAAEKLSSPAVLEYSPIEENSLGYDIIYAKYKRLHDAFGTGELKGII